jgi:capsule biosynthesis phosphatase
MYIIIPLGGLGTRFKKFGYTNPKPLVNVFGKPILFWLLDNLNLSHIDKILIPYNKELKKYNFEEDLINKYPKHKFKFLELESDTRGATETLLKMLDTLPIETDDCPILSLDGDNFYNCDIITQWNGENKIFTFEDYNTESIYSYIKFENEKIIDIIEKVKISDFACCGSYGFNSWKNLKYYCNYIIDNNILQKGEFYVSNAIKQMILDNIIFKNSIIPKEHYICLGTPLHVKIFCNNCPKFSNVTKKAMIEHKRICFDLDNTLVSYPLISGDYTSVKPIDHNIEFLRSLKQVGHTIIIYTARRMKTHGGNTGKLMKDIGKITFDTLDKFNIPYDEIYFGKPYADFYIDDKGINVFSELDKELGFYNSKIDTRDFNNLVIGNTIEVLKKTSNNLEGQINYYLNIPVRIKELFPFFFSYDNVSHKWYDMEKINGIPISKLFIKNELTLDLFSLILTNLNKIHDCQTNETFELNIYENYCNKLKNRYENYNFKKFENIEITYSEISTKLKEYENKNMGKTSMIHGDPVFTNIIINNSGKIKFIDMRGNIGNLSTVRGDIFYDYAKIYQSLIGYDEILNDTYVNQEYKDKLITFFKDKFIEKFGLEYWKYLSYITASLLLTLIPLHDNEKCFKYYNLIKKLIS